MHDWGKKVQLNIIPANVSVCAITLRLILPYAVKCTFRLIKDDECENLFMRKLCGCQLVLNLGFCCEGKHWNGG